MNWDLVNHDLLPADRVFRLGKRTRFSDFKRQIQETTGVPVEMQRCGMGCEGRSSSHTPMRPEYWSMSTHPLHSLTRSPPHSHVLLLAGTG